MLAVIRKNPTLTFFFVTIFIFANLIGCKPEPEEKEKKVTTREEETTTKSDKSAKKTEEPPEQSEKPKTQTVKLYFADKNSEYLVSEEREVFDSSKLVQNTLEELIKGPHEEGHIKTIPKGTKILSINITNDTCLINFSRELVDNHPGGSASELMTIYSIVDTLTEFSGLKKVKFLVEGQEVESLAGHFDLTQPVERDESMIKK